MAAKITRDILESYLHCKFKGHLKLTGQQGTKSDYENLLTETRADVRLAAIDKILTRHPGEEIPRNILLTTSALKEGASFLLDASLEDDLVSLVFDGLKKVDGPSKLGGFHYIPMIFHEGEKVRKEQKLLLDLYGLLLLRLQGRAPNNGIIWHGKDCQVTKVRLNSDQGKIDQVLQELKEMRRPDPPLKLILNEHCQICEFRQRCQAQAVQEDNISLLRGLGEKEIRKYNRKGIFTTTQLSCTFRPRKKGKRVKHPGPIHYFALQALAIREKKTYVYGIPSVSAAGKTRVYFDVEGDPDQGIVYLLGLIIATSEGEQRYSFWANNPGEEESAFRQFLTVVGQYDDFCVYHFGSYETFFLRRMRKQARKKALIDKVLRNSVNVLSLVRSNIYFPTFSNGLKDIGSHLGCAWTDAKATGIQSIVWRRRWEQTHDEDLKRTLVQYNMEDCAALQVVTGHIYKIAAMGTTEETKPSGAGQPEIAWAHDIQTQSSRREWGGPAFVLPDFDYINKCAYFDYQRDKVFLRTNKRLRTIHSQSCTKRRRKRSKANRRIVIRAVRCPFCKGRELTRFEDRMHIKVAFDLKITRTGVAKQVIECAAVEHQCPKCRRPFLPTRYKRRDKHFHALKSWAMYQHVVHRVSFQSLEVMFEECFGLRICYQELHMIKSLMARRYQTTYRGILQKIVAGHLIHADETHANLQKGKGNVWVFTNLEEVVYLYKPSREGEFLHELLRGFKGVLVSDFFSAYDSIPCAQQKCLIHLIRDLNHDLLNHPYDEEYREVVREFGQLLRSVVSTIDRFGLKQRHLNKHIAEVDRFFKKIAGRRFGSEVAESYQSRLIKNEDKLFTFLRHDGVPWNNNNAEHAIKHYARYRVITDGKMTATGLSDYLVLLSIYQTCQYKGVSFLKFLLSQEQDIDVFSEAVRRKCSLSKLEVYPKGFPRMYARKQEPGQPATEA